VAEAHARIQAHPGRYIDHVYGEFENGGTSYLILSHVPFAELGLPALTERPVKEVSEQVMGFTIPFAVTWGAILSGTAVAVHWFNKRKEAVAAENETKAKQLEEADK
jgi:formate dehydrogenase iron-sulfur subunit